MTYTPIFFILIITIIAAEAWWFWFNYPHDQNLSLSMFLVLEIIILLCLILSFLSFAGKFFEKFIFFAPFVGPVSYFMMTGVYLILEKKQEKDKLKQEISKVLKLSGLIDEATRYERIGDIYFSKLDFENAFLWYRKSRSLKESPEIIHKLSVAKQEVLLKKKKIWICPKCSITNSNKDKKCKSCGAFKPSVETFKQEFSKNIPDLKKNFFILVFLTILISFFVWYIRNASFFTSFIFFSILFVAFAIFVIYKIFSR